VQFTVQPSQSQADANVYIVGPILKVRPTDQPGGASSASLLAARNEFESFQIVIQAGSSVVQGVNVTLSAPLNGPGAISANNVTIYREDYYNVVVPSDQEGAPGRWPDVLIPVVDTLLGQQRNAFPIDVPAGENRVVWVDVLVPQNATVGMYSGSITITAVNFNATVPIQLTVFDATLPSTSSLQSAFALGWDDVCIAKYGQGCFSLNPPNEEEGWSLNELIARAALNNRITISNPQYQPLNTGNLQFFRKYILPLLMGTAPTTQLPSAKLTSFQVDTGPSLAAWQNEAQLQGFADRAFVYACDEPLGDAAKWNACQQQASNAHAVWANIPILVTASIQNASLFNATGYINWLVPIVNDMDDKPGNANAGNQRSNYGTFLGLNAINRVWLYTSCFSYGCDPNITCQSSPSGSATNDPYFNGWPGYAIDEPASEARAMGWLSFLYDTTGELYYNVTHCLSSAWTAQYASGGNGDGTLFYPGNPQNIGGTDWIPLESMRLKLIRDGYEDYEYLKILANSGQNAIARQIAQRLFANMYTTNRSDADVQAARHQLAHLIDPINVS
jgi:Domain of unknown function (DUF4091)